MRKNRIAALLMPIVLLLTGMTVLLCFTGSTAASPQDTGKYVVLRYVNRETVRTGAQVHHADKRLLESRI